MADQNRNQGSKQGDGNDDSSVFKSKPTDKEGMSGSGGRAAVAWVARIGWLRRIGKLGWHEQLRWKWAGVVEWLGRLGRNGRQIERVVQAERSGSSGSSAALVERWVRQLWRHGRRLGGSGSGAGKWSSGSGSDAGYSASGSDDDIDAESDG